MTQLIVGVAFILAAVLVVFVGHALSGRGYSLDTPEQRVRIGPTGRPLPEESYGHQGVRQQDHADEG